MNPASTDVILDTNVVLDWLVFQHPPALPLGEDIMTGRRRWISTPEMREELVDVLGRLHTHPPLQRWRGAYDAAMTAAQRWSVAVPTPAPLPPARQLRCTDPDDQCFIDLAVATATPWLLTRDRALLRLARPAKPWGVTVCTPERWRQLTEV